MVFHRRSLRQRPYLDQRAVSKSAPSLECMCRCRPYLWLDITADDSCWGLNRLARDKDRPKPLKFLWKHMRRLLPPADARFYGPFNQKISRCPRCTRWFAYMFGDSDRDTQGHTRCSPVARTRNPEKRQNRSIINCTREGRVAIKAYFPDRLRGRGKEKERKWYLGQKSGSCG